MLYKFAILVMKSLGRNKVRTLLTGLGIMVLVAIFSVVTNVTSTVKRKISSQGQQTRLIVSERWTAPSRVPVRYIPEIARQEGVVDWTSMNFFIGFLDEAHSRDQQVIGFAVRPDNIREMQPTVAGLSDEEFEAFLDRKDAALVGSGLLKLMNWQVGQSFIVHGMRYPPVSVPLTIVGTLPPGDMSFGFFWRQDYYAEATGDGDNVNAILLEVANPDDAQTIASALMADYENRQPSLKVETESAGAARFAARGEAVLQIIDVVVAILLIDMVIILSNSISISVRERRVEMAVLKVLGFQPLHITLMIIAEAMLVGALAGLFGTGIVCLLSDLTLREQIPLADWNRFMMQFPVPWSLAPWGMLIGAGVGITGSVIPASSARSIKVSDVFSKIA